MTNYRPLLQAGAVVALVGLLVFGALSLLSDEGDDTPTGPDDENIAATEEVDGKRPLVAEAVSDAQKARARHNNPWPFGDFAEDISSLLRPGRREIMFARDEAERAVFGPISTHKLSIQLDNASVGDVVRALAAEFEPMKVRVYEGEPKVPDSIVFKRVYLTDVTLQQVTVFLKVRSRDQVFTAVTPAGVCIGSKNACTQARLDAEEWEADLRSKMRTDPDDFLDVDYRPDVRGASLGRLIRDIREKTSVEVVVGPRTWETGIVFTWVDDPQPLRDALDSIAEKLGARVFVKDGRAFLLSR